MINPKMHLPINPTTYHKKRTRNKTVHQLPDLAFILSYFHTFILSYFHTFTLPSNLIDNRASTTRLFFFSGKARNGFKSISLIW